MKCFFELFRYSVNRHIRRRKTVTDQIKAVALLLSRSTNRSNRFVVKL